jgi:Type IV secretion-system coupling protein DNA-binding domain
MTAHILALTHGFLGFKLAYVLVLVSMLAALIRKRAYWMAYLVWWLLAVPIVLTALLIFALLFLWLPGEGTAIVGILRVLVALLLFPLLGYWCGEWLGGGVPPAFPEHRRGAIVSRAAPKSARRRAGITLAGIPVDLKDETKHFKLIGATGTGKSTAIREMLVAALERGDRAIIADPDGGYLARFYAAERGDVILNPFDGDAHKWDLFGEITNDYDVEQLARSLIPDSGGSDRIWSQYARTFFSAVVQQAIVAETRNDTELCRLVISASTEELRVLLAGTPAGPFLELGNEKMFGSVRAITSSAVEALKYTTRQQAGPFSVRQWVRKGSARDAGGRGGVLFLPYKAGEIAALRSVISAWMRIGIFEAMDRDEGDQRLWFVVDELDALGEIDGLKDALARLRKFGGRCILGFQSIAQVSGTYGKGIAETIVENCGNTLILRCSASEHGGTSEFASKLIGQREVVHTTVSTTRRDSEWMGSTTTGQNLRIEPAVMASEIERLPDLSGLLKLASVPDWQVVRLTPMTGAAPVRLRRPSVLTSPPIAAALRTTSPPAAVAPTARTKPRRERQTKAAAFRTQISPRGRAAESATPQGVAARVKDTAATSVQPPPGAAE